MEDRLKNLTKIRVSIFIFFIFQSAIILTWFPLDRGELNPALSAVGAIPMGKPYGDYKVIASAIQYYEQGGNPYETGRFDFAGRKYNYPAYWLKFPILGVENHNLKYVYIVFATLFCIGVGLVFWGDKTKFWYGYFPFLFSPPVFLGLERCNYELIVFFLVVLAVWVCCRGPGMGRSWVGGSILYLATILKVFPVFGFLIFVRESWKRTLLFLIPFGILSAAYFVYSRPYLKLVHENTPWSQYISFGINVIPFNVSKWIAPESEVMQVYLLGVAWLTALAFILLGYVKGKKALKISGMESYDAYLFRAAAVIYIAVYLMGSNFDYRLIFLLPTLPFVFRMLREDPNGHWIHTLYLICMFIGMWMSEINILWRADFYMRSAVLMINELSFWIVLFYCIRMQFKLLPAYIREIIYREQSAPSMDSSTT